MPLDFKVEKIRLVTGSMNSTISSLAIANPNSSITEPSGSLIRTQDGRIWINTTGGSVWHPMGPTKFDTIFSGSITGTLDAVLARNASVGGALTASNGLRAVNRVSLVTTTTAAPASTTTWGTAWTTFGPNADGLTSAAVGVGYNTNNDYGTINSLAPSIAWKPLVLGANSYSFTVAGTEQFGVDSVGNVFAKLNLNVTGSITGSGDVILNGALTCSRITAVDSLSGTINARIVDLSGSVTGRFNGLYDTILAGTSASDAAVQVSLKAGASASLIQAYSNIQTGVTASISSIYSTILAGTSASDGTYYSTILTGVSASDGTYYNTILAGTSASDGTYYNAILTGISASDAAVQISLKAGVTSSINSIYSTILAGTSASDSTYYSTILTGVSASDAAVQTSLKAGVTASFTSWGSDHSVVGVSKFQNRVEITGVLDIQNRAVLRGAVGATVTPTAGVEFVLGRNSSDTIPGAVGDIAFNWYGGGYKHWISTNHNSAGNSAGNAIRFWLNDSAGAGDSSAPNTGSFPILSLYGDRKAVLSGALHAVSGLTSSGGTQIGGSTANQHELIGNLSVNGTAPGAGYILGYVGGLVKWTVLSGAGGISGAGTTGYVPKWIDTYTVGDSLMQSVGGQYMQIDNAGLVLSMTGSTAIPISLNISHVGGGGAIAADSNAVDILWTAVNVDTSAAERNVYGLRTQVSVTRSLGANPAAVYGIRSDTANDVDASQNWAFYSSLGNVRFNVSNPNSTYTRVGSFYSDAYTYLNYQNGGVATTEIHGRVTAFSGSLTYGSITGTLDARFDRNISAGADVTASIDARVGRNLTVVGTAATNTITASTGTMLGLNVMGSVTASSLDVSVAITSPTITTINNTITALSGTVDRQRQWDGLDPLRGARIFDDFLADTISRFSLSGDGSSAVAGSEYGHPGMVRLNTTTSGTSTATTWFGDGTPSAYVLLGGGPINWEACLRRTVVDDNTHNASIVAGIHVISATPTTHGVYFDLNRTRYGDNEFRFCAAATGSRVVRKTGVTAASLRFYRLVIDVAPDGNVVTGSIYCSGTLISTITNSTYVPGNLPVVGLLPAILSVKTLGSGGTRSTDVDYHVFQQLFSASRP